MKYAVEIDLGAMIYIPSFIKIDSGIQKLTGRGSQTHRHEDTERVWRLHETNFRKKVKNGHSMNKQKGHIDFYVTETGVCDKCCPRGAV
jgi:hypothetical protein